MYAFRKGGLGSSSEGSESEMTLRQGTGQSDDEPFFRSNRGQP